MHGPIFMYMYMHVHDVHIQCKYIVHMHIPSQTPPSHQPLCLQCLVVAAGRLAKKDLFGLWYMYMYTVMYKLLNLPGTHVLHVHVGVP